MNLTSITSLEYYDEIVSKYKLRNSYTNNYMLREEILHLIETGNLSEISTENNVFFFVRKPKCSRLYYYLNDTGELMVFDKENFVVEILYRGETFYPRIEIDFFVRCGFSINLIRDQYSAIYKDLTLTKDFGRVSVNTASTIEEVKYACELFNNSFDPFSGDFIPESKYEMLRGNGDVLVAMIGDTFAGALHQVVENNVAWISHVAVEEHARRQHVGQVLVDFFVDSNMKSEKSRYVFWVQQQNMAAVNMYRKKGFKYINKSTISLLKINE